MKTIIFIIFLANINCFAAFIERGPYVENGSSKSMTVRFRTNVSTSAWITYGAYPDCERFNVFLGVAKEHKAGLNGLLPDTTHCYRIYIPVDASSNSYKADESFFRTFKEEKGESFSFLAFGDSGSGSEEQKKLAGKMASFEEIYFTAHTGDLIDSGLDSDADAQYFSMYSKMLRKIPFFIALGNHDYGENAKTKEGAGFLKKNFAPFHSVPLNGLPPHYYYFDFADSRFIVLDSNRFFSVMYAPSLEKDSQQYKWLESVLKNTLKKWKFVIMHQPVYSSGEHGVIDEQKETLTPLFDKYSVDIVFQGHDHNYERTKPIKEDEENPKGTVYVTLGGGGRSLYQKTSDSDLSEVFQSKHHFAHIEISENKLVMNVHSIDDEILDTMVIEKKQ